MKIITWISNVEQLIKYSEIWIDEFYFWYVPNYWVLKYWFEVSINRRYKYNRQFLSKYNLVKLLNNSKILNKKIFLTLNEQFYTNEQLFYIKKYIEEIEQFWIISWIIVADMFLLDFLQKIWYKNNIHLSWDFWIYNTETLNIILKKYNSLNISRFIFPREMSIKEVKEFVEFIKNNRLNIETEVFILWDPCIFNGSSCRASHWYWKDGLCYTIKYDNYSYTKDIIKDIKIWWKKCWFCFVKIFNEIWIDFLKVPWRWNSFISDLQFLKKIVSWNIDFSYIKTEKEKINGEWYCNWNNCYYNIKEIQNYE